MIKLFSLCDGMKWNHLPEPGGIYQQNPELMDRFYFILSERAKFQASEQAKKDRAGPKPTSRASGSRRR